MAAEARGFVKTSLVCLILGSISGTIHFGWGALLDGVPPAWLRPLHIHLATVGWLINRVFGDALWMFPMPAGATREFRARYSRGAAIACFLALIIGLAIRFVAEPSGIALLGLMSGVLQTLGIGLGILMLWPRIRAISPPPLRGP